MPPRRDDDDDERWEHDDQTERSPRQRSEAERDAFDAHQRWIYKLMKKVRDQIYDDLRHPWAQP